MSETTDTLGATILDESGNDKPKGAPRVTPTPKVNAGAGRPSKLESNVNAALATMEGIYSLVGMLLSVAAPETKKFLDWDKRVIDVQEKNKASLTASPKLAESISKIGDVGGTGSFISAQLITFAPIIGVAAVEVRARIQAAREVAQGTQA